jgi:hypothetical protein
MARETTFITNFCKHEHEQPNYEETYLLHTTVKLFFFTILEGNVSYQYPDIMKKLDGIPQLLPGPSPLSIHDQAVHTGNWNPNLQ